MAMNVVGLVKKHNPVIIMAAQVLIFHYYFMLVVSVTYLEFLIFTVNCIWGPWSVWEACSVTCGGGTLEMNREITQEAKYGGNECTGNDKETLLCSTNHCPGFNNLSYVFVLGSGTHKNI